MILIIGGSYQGKTDFAKEKFGLTDADVFACEDTCIDLSKAVITHMERYALACVKAHGEPAEFWRKNMDALKDKILISDDVSCGVVPMDTTLRAWREANGRANNWLASQADEVWRVFCGLGMRIK